jgi:hypothetical protein
MGEEGRASNLGLGLEIRIIHNLCPDYKSRVNKNVITVLLLNSRKDSIPISVSFL